MEFDREHIGLNITAPFVSSYISTLGGTPSLMLTVSLDKRSDWINNIMENSRYAHFMVSPDGTVEHFSGSLPKFRKCHVADDDGLIAKINQWIAKVSTPKELA
jgi:hypothetical protein